MPVKNIIFNIPSPLIPLPGGEGILNYYIATSYHPSPCGRGAGGEGPGVRGAAGIVYHFLLNRVKSNIT